MRLHGVVNSTGLLDDLEFGVVKKLFRDHLDSNYDHRLLLNERDPWAQGLSFYNELAPGRVVAQEHLPGLQTVQGDPTTENIARWIAKWANMIFERPVDIIVHETAVNAAGFSYK